jgi:hypothetical protein
MAGASNAFASQRLPWALPGDSLRSMLVPGLLAKAKMATRGDVIRAANFQLD